MFGWRIPAGYLDGQRAGVIKEERARMWDIWYWGNFIASDSKY